VQLVHIGSLLGQMKQETEGDTQLTGSLVCVCVLKTNFQCCVDVMLCCLSICLTRVFVVFPNCLNCNLLMLSQKYPGSAKSVVEVFVFDVTFKYLIVSDLVWR